MERKTLKFAVCALAIGLVCTLSGCANGIGDTIDLVKNAETAKQAAAQMVNGNGNRVVVGSLADPSYKAKEQLSILDFSIFCSGTVFQAEWKVKTDSPAVQIQIFADTDTDNADGVKIASFDSEDPTSAATFQYQNLDDGSYYCYIKVTGADGAPVVAYSSTPITVVQESPEGSLQDISIGVENGYVVFSWADDSKANQMYHAMLIDPNDTNSVLADSTVIDMKARIEIPSGEYEFIYAAVASYNDGKIGPYRLYKINLDINNEASDIKGDEQ